MKALLVDRLSEDLSGVSLVDLPLPTRAPGEVLVRVRAASLNYPDLLMTRGEYQFRPDPPFTSGMELAGEVVEADADAPFAVCYADLDHFKEFNDRYSYYDGDRVIFLLSRILHDVVRGGAVLR